MSNKTNCGFEPGWYAKEIKGEEDRIRVPDDVLEKVDGKTNKRSLPHSNFKEFVGLCESLEKSISELTRDYDRPRSNEDYFNFKKELIEIKNKAIIEAYNNKMLKWKY